jgi:2',3'-cyclic-nucleotide 2'-phosphodiesterase (5'-nucleotidase family)
MRKSHFLPFIIVLFIQASCNPAFKSASVQYSTYRIQPSGNYHSTIVEVMKPYSDSVNMSMNDVIGENANLLEKVSKKSVLGYFMADAFLYMAKQKFNTDVDVAVINHGGIRLNELAPGEITKGKIFELMPFDNLLVLQKIKGRVLKQYLDTLALSDAVNLSGISLTISNKITKNIIVGDKPLDENKEYVIANSDYNISTSELLKSVPVHSIGYLQRDAIIDYVMLFAHQGKKIVVENTNRIAYAE